MSALSKLGKIAARKAEELAAKRAARETEELVVKKAARKAEELAVRPKPKPKPAPKALPAPPKRLALPAPGPGLPEYAAKPRGGQWWTPNSAYALMAPSEAAKEAAYLSERFSSAPRDKALADWFDKALARYFQNDLATPEDPLRGLADQGLLAGVQNAAQWSGRAKQDIVPFPMQKLLFDPKAAGVREEILGAMPWLNKVPATDTIYGVWPREGTKEVYGHVADEMRNALNPEASGLPLDLAVRPESLGHMSFPQAVERVGRINQWRAKQAEQAALSNLDSPAIHTFKEYAENNPRGLRWVELKAPELVEPVPGWEEATAGVFRNPAATGQAGSPRYVAADDLLDAQRRQLLGDALRYEGDTMGHCVGGYCDDVISGRSRIFSLRDAKGEPHVTIETAPGRRVFSDVAAAVGGDVANQWLHDEGLSLPDMVKRANIPTVEDIIQIKGKQNRAPNDEYLPFVQDFVKSQQWGNIGDLGNTGLVKLPDGRYITQAQWNEGIRNAVSARNPQWTPERLDQVVADAYRAPSRLQEDRWEPDYKRFFEGFAIGGKVSADRCFCRHPFSAKG